MIHSRQQCIFIITVLSLAQTQADNQIIIIGANRVIKGSFIPSLMPAFLATMDDAPTFFARVQHRDRLEQPLASIRPIPWVNIHMQRIETIRAVVTVATVGKWWHIPTTMRTAKCLIRSLGNKTTAQSSSSSSPSTSTTSPIPERLPRYRYNASSRTSSTASKPCRWLGTRWFAMVKQAANTSSIMG